MAYEDLDVGGARSITDAISEIQKAQSEITQLKADKRELVEALPDGFVPMSISSALPLRIEADVIVAACEALSSGKVQRLRFGVTNETAWAAGLPCGGNIEVLRGFVTSGQIPMVRSVGQVPDTLTEIEALELKLIVRDTLMAPALDSLFRTARAQEGRVYPFDPSTFGMSPVSKKPFLLKAGSISSSNRNVPVFIAKDPTPLVVGDTLMVGNMEKPSTAGNWSGE